MKKLNVLILFLIVGFASAEKGYVLVQESKGQEAHVSMESKSTVYLVRDAMRIDTQSVMRMDTGNIPEEMKKQMPKEVERRTTTIQKIDKSGVHIYSIDHSKKTYIDFSETPEFIIISFMSTFINCDRQTGKCDLNKEAFKPTNEFRKINGYKARKVIIKTPGMHPGFDGMEMITWFTKENKDLVGAEKMKTDIMMNAVSRTEFGKNNPKLVKDLGKFLNDNIKKYGAPIKWEMPGGEVVITSVKKKDINKNMFELPKGYKKVLPPF